MIFQKANRLQGEVTVPGDKSISHRGVMFGALSEGTTRLTHFLQGADCLSTISCFEKMGIPIENNGNEILVHGKGLHGLTAPTQILDAGNSGTTTRLISGILAAQDFSVTLTGDASICKRPMRRIMEPLSLMGANIKSQNGNDCAPLLITGSHLHGIHYQSKVASAQVKSSILLAGLYADGTTSVTEPALSRNHSELMLGMFGAKVESRDTTATIYPEPALHAIDFKVPGDISSAAYFIAAASIVPGSELLIRNVGINPTRDGILRIAQQMGADITLLNRVDEGEPTADLLVRSATLHGTEIGGDVIPTLIDEIPVLAVMTAYAQGETVIKDAAELKVKESDRIAIVTENLKKMGADVTPTDDGMIIRGGRPLHGGKLDSHLDHRIAMSFAIAALIADGETEMKDAECVNISYPDFYQDLASCM